MEKFGLLSDTEATLAALVLDSAYKCRDIFPENKRLDQVFSIMNNPENDCECACERKSEKEFVI